MENGVENGFTSVPIAVTLGRQICLGSVPSHRPPLPKVDYVVAVCCLTPWKGFFSASFHSRRIIACFFSCLTK